jgi:hypothetical protein
LHTGNARGVVGAIEGEKYAVGLAEASEAELQHGFREGRLRAHGRASADIRGRSQEHKIDEVAAGDREIGDFLGLDHLADFRLLCVDALRRLADLDLFSEAIHTESHGQRGNLSDGEGESSAIRTELRGVDSQLIVSGRKAGNDSEPRGVGKVTPLRSGLGVFHGQSSLGNAGA